MFPADILPKNPTLRPPPGPLPTTWLGELELWFEVRQDRTVLTRQRHLGPLVVQRPFHPEKDGTCHVYLLHPPGGVAAGDTLETSIHLAPGSRTLLTTPGAGKFYRSAHGQGVQRLTMDIGKDAVCEYLPQETILFDGADATIETRIRLAAGATYVGWDFLSFGRPAADETFTVGKVSQRIEVMLEGSPLWLERLHLTGGSALLKARHGLAGQPILGAMIHVGHAPDDCAGRIRAALGGGADRVFSVTQLERVVVCRYLGPRLSQAKSLFARAWDVLRMASQGKPASVPRIWAT